MTEPDALTDRDPTTDRDAPVDDMADLDVEPRRAGSRAKLAGVVFGLVLALIAGFGLGRLYGPVNSTSGGTPVAQGSASPAHVHGSGGAANGVDATAGGEVGGLAITASGYTLVPAATQVPAGVQQPYAFTITGPDGRPVTNFAVVHDKKLHFIVARRDLSGFQHLHPAMDPDGTWRIPMTLPEPGIYRVFADFTAIDPGGKQVAATLGADLTVTGAYAPRPLPAPQNTATADGYTVTYQGTPNPASVQPFLFKVTRDGQPVTLDRYLAAYGHLVVLRDGDLAYVHVHPEDQLADGQIKFWLAAPGPGLYRLYLDVQVAGQVHTAEFTLKVG